MVRGWKSYNHPSLVPWSWKEGCRGLPGMGDGADRGTKEVSM